MRPPVVAIDGAAGSGKSTLAKLLARQLGLPYVNTGAMYRALTAAARRSGIGVDDVEGLLRMMRTLRFRLSPIEPRELWIDDAPPADELDSDDVEAHVSAVARHPAVREAMRSAQRSLGERGAVMEGRDIGSAVFPDAPLKLWLVADARERAGRRVEERGAGGVAGALHERDRRDARVNPFVPTEDAIVIDTGELDVAATVWAALEAVAEHAPELLPGPTR